MNKNAFTLIELLATSVILLFVLTAAFSTYVMLSQYVKDTITQATLQSKARIAIEKIARNIRLASAIDCSPSGNSIILTFYPSRLGQTGNSSWSSEYRLSDGQISFFPDITSLKETLIVDNVDLDRGDKLFDEIENNLIAINLKVRNVSISTEQYVGLTTIVKLRNAD